MRVQNTGGFRPIGEYKNNFAVKYGFDESEKTEQIFWKEILKNHVKQELMYQFVKCGLESVSLDAVRKSMTYTKKKAQYRSLKENLEKAKIQVYNEDMIDFLESTDKVFDLIDITNILIFVFQDIDCNEILFNERLKAIKKAFDKNVGTYGRFADAVKYIDPREE